MTIEQLRQKLRELAAKSEAIVKKAEADNKRALTMEEAQEIQTIAKEFGDVRTQLEAREAATRMKAESEAPVTSPGAVGNGANPYGLQIVGGQQVTRGMPGSPGMWGFNSAADFASAVRNAVLNPHQADRRLEQLRARATDVQNAPSGQLGENTGQEAGWMVPPDIMAGIRDVVFQHDDLLSLVAPTPTNSTQVGYYIDETTPWGAAGVKAKWRSEATQMTATGKPTADPHMLRVHEMYAFVPATDESLADAPSLSDRLTNKAGLAISWLASEAIMRGTGVGQPLGFMNGPGSLVIAKEAGQATATIVLANILNAFARFFPFGGSFRWLAHRGCITQLAQLTLGQNGIFMLPQLGIPAAPQGALLGIPLSWSEHCKALGTAGDLLLFDPAAYVAATRGGIQFASSMHLWFDYSTTCFRWTFRLAGSPMLSKVIAPAYGDTRSPFIAIADRP